MNAYPEKQHYTADDLAAIIAILRDPENGCPWDKVQTHRSIRMNFLEEAYEAVDAIDLDDPELLCEELGDVLFSAVNIARFLKVDAEDSLNASTEKFINRFCKVEQLAQQQGIDLEQASVEQMEQLWKQAKNQ